MTAIAKRADGSRVEPGKAKQQRSRNISAWREILRKHAAQRWADSVDCLSNGKPISPRDDAALIPLISSLGTQGEEAIRIVDRFALGCAAEAVALGQAGKKPGQEFTSQLDFILDGFDSINGDDVQRRFAEAERESELHRPHLIQSELWQLLHKVRESAELSYAREIELVALDRRIMFLLISQGPLVPASISAAAGVDKAQVSRSVKRLLDLGLVEREQIRSPVGLTDKGTEVSNRLLRRADLRNRELSFDVSDSELAEFFSVIETLLDRSVVLYEQEREIARSTGEKDRGPDPEYEFEERRSGEPIAMDRSRIVSPMLTLSAYLSRSAALAYKRLIGLSNFESWVLSEISYDAPTDWPRLVRALERDHSQAGRTVNALIERGLVTREGKPARRHGRFTPTEKGKELYAVIVETGQARAEFLLGGLPEEEIAAFTAVFDKIARNAAAQLQRERAFREIEGR